MTQLPSTEQILKTLSYYYDHSISAERIATALKLDLEQVLDVIRLYEGLGRPPRRSRVHAPPGVFTMPRDSAVH